MRRAVRPFCAIQLSLLRLLAQWETTCLLNGSPSDLPVTDVLVVVAGTIGATEQLWLAVQDFQVPTG